MSFALDTHALTVATWLGPDPRDENHEMAHLLVTTTDTRQAYVMTQVANYLGITSKRPLISTWIRLGGDKAETHGPPPRAKSTRPNRHVRTDKKPRSTGNASGWTVTGLPVDVRSTLMIGKEPVVTATDTDWQWTAQAWADNEARLAFGTAPRPPEMSKDGYLEAHSDAIGFIYIPVLPDPDYVITNL